MNTFTGYSTQYLAQRMCGNGVSHSSLPNYANINKDIELIDRYGINIIADKYLSNINSVNCFYLLKLASKYMDTHEIYLKDGVARVSTNGLQVVSLFYAANRIIDKPHEYMLIMQKVKDNQLWKDSSSVKLYTDMLNAKANNISMLHWNCRVNVPDEAFKDNKTIREVVFDNPDNTKANVVVGSKAFAGSHVMHVQSPSSNTSIQFGAQSFKGCSSRLVIDTMGKTEFGYQAFDNAILKGNAFGARVDAYYNEQNYERQL